MIEARHEWVRVPIGTLREGETFRTSARGRTFRVGEPQRWTRWDEKRMVTVIDAENRGLAAREETFTVEALRWSDDNGREFTVLRGMQLESLMRQEGLLA